MTERASGAPAAEGGNTDRLDENFADTTSDQAAGSIAIPTYFGASNRPLFGWLHRPSGGSARANVVLCSSLGYEGLFLHPTLRALAKDLAETTQAVVLRFDYDGTGDSAGTDEDPDRVAAWLASVDSAIETIKRYGAKQGPIVLVGVRAGALLAAATAARRDDISGLVLWAPSSSGKEFVREQRAFALLAHATAADPSAGQIDWGKGGFEANGYVFTSETAERLAQLSFERNLDPSYPVLLLTRDESPGSARLVQQWQTLGAAVESDVAEDSAGMIEPPSTLRLPRASLSSIVDWVRRSFPENRKYPLSEAPRRQGAVTVEPGVSELPVWYAGRDRFAILTAPEGRPTERVMLFLNNASGNRVGPHGMVPTTARLLARHGVASLRLDLGGVGDSELPIGRAPHHPYDLVALEDVRAAVAYLRARGFKQIAAGGLCSAAFLAWHAASENAEIGQLLLINPQTFEWNEGDSLEVSPLQRQYEFESYRQSVRSIGKWRRVLRGEVALSHVADVFWTRFSFVVSSQFQSTRTALGIGGSRSSVAKLARSIGARGGRISVIFSSHDPGIPNLQRRLGGSMRSLVRRRVVSVHVIKGPDHSFTPRWATRELNEAIVRELAPDA